VRWFRSSVPGCGRWLSRPDNVERDFRQVREGTPFEWVVPHTYRKTVVTLLDDGGLSARVVADQLGHALISMTRTCTWTAGVHRSAADVEGLTE
jgi:integrase